MIKLLFAPGCYGTFLSKCVFELTNLSDNNLNLSQGLDFVFDQSGSSHDFRKNASSKNFILYGHPSNLKFDNNDQIISVIPCQTNFLDYYDNQFCKHQLKQIVTYIETMFSSQEIQEKLYHGWKYGNKLDSNTPIWILREWCSFWLKNCLESGYNANLYTDIPAEVYITTQELFSDLPGVLKTIAKKFNLKLIATYSQIKDIQQKFVSAQIFHDMQNRCDIWVNKTLEGHDHPSPCQTLFDEAWVQHSLRSLGYEIQCDGLNKFPLTSKDLSKIIYNNA